MLFMLLFDSHRSCNMIASRQYDGHQNLGQNEDWRVRNILSYSLPSNQVQCVALLLRASISNQGNGVKKLFIIRVRFYFISQSAFALVVGGLGKGLREEKKASNYMEDFPLLCHWSPSHAEQENRSEMFKALIVLPEDSWYAWRVSIEAGANLFSLPPHYFAFAVEECLMNHDKNNFDETSPHYLIWCFPQWAN